MFAPSINPYPHRGQSDGGGKTDWARDKVCHPELVSGSKLSAKHTSPYPVLDLLHAHGDSTKSLRLSSLVPFAIRTYFVSSVRKSASYLGEGNTVYIKADG